MFDFIQKLIYFVLSLQGKFFGKASCFEEKSSYTQGSSKMAFCEAASLQLNVKTNEKKDKVKNNVEHIIKSAKGHPKELIKFIEKNSTKVFVNSYLKKVLEFFGFNDYFIPPQSGMKAICLNLALAIFAKGSVSAKSEAIFVLSDSSPEPSIFIQQFYKWYSMKFNLPGFDEKSQENFNKFMNESINSNVSDLSIDEILGLKEAIARDVEAINFVIEFAKTTDGAKSAVKKISMGGASV